MWHYTVELQFPHDLGNMAAWPDVPSESVILSPGHCYRAYRAMNEKVKVIQGSLVSPQLVV